MSFKAQSIARDPNGEIVGVGPARKFGTVTVTGTMAEHFGDPPEAMLADDNVLVQTVTGTPWPRSVEDRRCKQPGQAELAQLRGEWPRRRDVKMSSFVDAKLTEPVQIGVALLVRQGWKREDAERYVKSQQHGGDEDGVPDLATLLPAKK